MKKAASKRPRESFNDRNRLSSARAKTEQGAKVTALSTLTHNKLIMCQSLFIFPHFLNGSELVAQEQQGNRDEADGESASRDCR